MLPVTCHHECPPLSNASACVSHLGCDWFNSTGDGTGYCAISSSQEFSGKAWIGVMLSLVGDIIINIGMNAMKHAHNINTDPDTNQPIKHFTRIPWWWIGIFGIIGGEVGNLIAYGYAPASIVTPIGSIGVVTNVIITTFVLKETFTMKNLLGVILVIAGIVIVVLFAPLTVIFVGSANLWEDVIYTSNMAIYLSWMVVMLAILYPLSRKYGEKTVVLYVALCAVIASLTIVCAKTFATMVSNGFANGMETEFLSPWPYGTLAVMVVTCVLSMSYVNRAMMTFGNSQVVPVYFALFTTAGVGSAAWVYQEFQCLADANQAVGFFIGIIVAIFGVFLVSQGSSRKVSPSAVYADCEDKEPDLEQGEGEHAAGEQDAPARDGRKGPSASHSDGAGPTPDDLSPSTPPGPEGAGNDVESGDMGVGVMAMAQPDLPVRLAAPQSVTWMQHEATMHLQQQRVPQSPSTGHAACTAVQPLAPADARSLHVPPSESPPRGKREKQAKGMRCGLTMLKPLPPPVVVEGRDPVSGTSRAQARPACEAPGVVALPALPRVVTSPSPRPH